MIFDANTGMGRSGGSSGRYFSNSRELLTAMNQYGISRALVYSILAKETDCEEGNLLLIRNIKEEPYLLPCWVAVPNREEPENLISEMNNHNVRALRLFPHSGHFSIRPWCIGPLAKCLEQEKKLLLIDFESSSWSDDGVDWEGIYQLCKAFPQLPVVICGVTVAGPVNYRNLLRECANLHLEISQLGSPGEIKRLIEAGAVKQIIFGSALPAKHPGSVIAMLQKEVISERERQQIMNDNIAELLRLNNDIPAVSLASPQFKGIIDSHVHLGNWNHSMAGDGGAESIIKEMNRCGISSAILTSIWACYGEVKLGNQAVADACAKYPGRFYGYLTLDPKHSQEVRDEIKKHDSNPNIVGIKLHCDLHGHEFNGSECRPVLEYADSRAFPVLIHGSYNLDAWSEVCCKYPKVKFIVAHLGGCGPDVRLAVELAKCCRKFDNLHFDLAASKAFYGFLEELVELAGAEKILFGSDHPLFDFGYEMGQILYSNISFNDKNKILFKNADSIFGLNKTLK